MSEVTYEGLVQLKRDLDQRMDEARRQQHTIIVRSDQQEAVEQAVDQLYAEALLFADESMLPPKPRVFVNDWALEPGEALILNVSKIKHLGGTGER
jgi:hypothetical protein